MRVGPRSLRTRLFLLFSAGSSIILLGAALFLFVVLDGALLDETNEGLRARADDLAADAGDASITLPSALNTSANRS